MKKLLLVLLAVVPMVLVSCGGGNAGSKSSVSVTLDDLDDYFDVKSYKIETDVAEKGLENLEKAKGTLILVVKRNKTEMKLKPSDILGAEVSGETASSNYKVFRADVDGIARKLVKLEPGTEETLEIPIKIIDPFNRWNSDEENLEKRQAHYDALTGVQGALSEIYMVVLLKGEDDDY